MQYTGAKPEKVDQNIPLCSWTRNLRSCNSEAVIMLIVNERAHAIFTNDSNSFTFIKLDFYEAFVNQEESFREGPFTLKLLRMYSYIYECFMIEAQ